MSVGTKIFAAGYPLGDPEYSLSDGIISKKRANGQTTWSSTDHVLEHTAKINPGNSGGPLLTEEGKVVGINYASVRETDQSYALPTDVALPVINKLRFGKDLDGIGIHGQAWQLQQDGEATGQSVSWVWVYSVASGSPADDAGLLPGDLLSDIEGAPVSDDGTMKAYCDILRSHDSTDQMKINIVRLVGKEFCVYTGEINGDPLRKADVDCILTEPDPGPSIDDQPSIIATVRPGALNIRKGPGTNYPVLTTARQGEQLLVVGQVNNCSWLGIATRDGVIGFVAGNSQFVSLSASCANIPVLDL